VKIKTLKNTLPSGFSDPTSLPQDEAEQAVWQQQNQNWWQSHPMRYDFSDALAKEEFSPEVDSEIDRPFLTPHGIMRPGNKYPSTPWWTSLPFVAKMS
jgi:hypothetical protein